MNNFDICIACGKPCEDGQNECAACSIEQARQWEVWRNGNEDNAWADLVRLTKKAGSDE